VTEILPGRRVQGLALFAARNPGNSGSIEHGIDSVQQVSSMWQGRPDQFRGSERHDIGLAWRWEQATA